MFTAFSKDISRLTSLPNDKTFDLSKFKAFADDKVNVTRKLKFVLRRVENMVVNGENAGYQHFLLFPQCFQKLCFLGSLKGSELCGKVISIYFHISRWFHFEKPSPCGWVSRVQDLRTAGSWFDPWAWQPIFFGRIDFSHCDSILSSLTIVFCFCNGYVGKKQVDWKEYCAEYW